MSDFLTRLKEVKRKKGLTYRGFASILQESDETKQKFFDGRTAMSIEKVTLLAHTLNLNIEWLMSGKGSNMYADHAVKEEASDTSNVRPVRGQYPNQDYN